VRVIDSLASAKPCFIIHGLYINTRYIGSNDSRNLLPNNKNEYAHRLGVKSKSHIHICLLVESGYRLGVSCGDICFPLLVLIDLWRAI
jgi:hypothetical protein